MEDTHGDSSSSFRENGESCVLILIIMEDTHGVKMLSPIHAVYTRLNPYYNGRYSWRTIILN